MAIDHIFESSENTSTKMFVSDSLKDVKSLRGSSNAFFDLAFAIEQNGKVKYGLVEKVQRNDYTTTTDIAIDFHDAISLIESYMAPKEKATMEIHAKVRYSDIDGDRETHMVLSSALGSVQAVPVPNQYDHTTDVTASSRDKYFRVQSYSYQTSNAKQIEGETLLAANLIKVLQDNSYIPGHLKLGIAVNHTIDDYDARNTVSSTIKEENMNAKYDTLRV